jgi:hypothetical protein
MPNMHAQHAWSMSFRRSATINKHLYVDVHKRLIPEYPISEKSILKNVELGARVSMQVAEAKKDMRLLVTLSALGLQAAESQSTYLFAFLSRNVREEQKKGPEKTPGLGIFFQTIS